MLSSRNDDGDRPRAVAVWMDGDLPADPHLLEGVLPLCIGTSKIRVVFSDKSTEGRSIFLR